MTQWQIRLPFRCQRLHGQDHVHGKRRVRQGGKRRRRISRSSDQDIMAQILGMSANEMHALRVSSSAAKYTWEG
jgi:hypothetical protein